MEQLKEPLIDKKSNDDIDTFKSLFQISSSDDYENNRRKEIIFNNAFGNIDGLLKYLRIDAKLGINPNDIQDIE